MRVQLWTLPDHVGGLPETVLRGEELRAQLQHYQSDLDPDVVRSDSVRRDIDKDRVVCADVCNALGIRCDRQHLSVEYTCEALSSCLKRLL